MALGRICATLQARRDGGGVYRLIAEAAFNVTNNAGLRAGTKIETTTYTWDCSPEVQVATSYGEIFHSC